MKHDAHTFKNAGYTAQAHSTAPGEFALNVWWANEDSAGHQAILPATDAPALALAILEAAGFEDLSTGGLITGARSAVVGLKSYIAWEGSRAAEAKEQAKEQAKLEAEALGLFNLWRAGFDHEGYSEWTGETAELKGVWLAVARKARELGGRAEK